MKSALDYFCSLLGSQNVLLAAADKAPYQSDWRGRYHGDALCVVRPADVGQVAQVLAYCHSNLLSVVPQGGNTGLCGGATPKSGEVLISLKRLSQIKEVDTLNNSITVEAGCTLLQVQNAASSADRLFPLSLAAEGTATIGGNLATNAGGINVLQYGNARNLCLGIEVVLADGTIWNGLRCLYKDNSGYDLKHLFIGSEGSLGVITTAVLKLFPSLSARITVWVGLDSVADAVHLFRVLQKYLGSNLIAAELIGKSALELVSQKFNDLRSPLAVSPNWSLLIDIASSQQDAQIQESVEHALTKAQEAVLFQEAILASNLKQAAHLWKIRESIPEAERLEGWAVKHDISLPISALAEFIFLAEQTLKEKFSGVRIICFGHIGDGNLHYNLFYPNMQDDVEQKFIEKSAEANRIVYDLVTQLNGSISAEHGLGQLKREEILRYKSATEMNLMRAIKRSLDPLNIMNPGKLL